MTWICLVATCISFLPTTLLAVLTRIRAQCSPKITERDKIVREKNGVKLMWVVNVRNVSVTMVTLNLLVLLQLYILKLCGKFQMFFFKFSI